MVSNKKNVNQKTQKSQTTRPEAARKGAESRWENSFESGNSSKKQRNQEGISTSRDRMNQQGCPSCEETSGRRYSYEQGLYHQRSRHENDRADAQRPWGRDYNE